MNLKETSGAVKELLDRWDDKYTKLNDEVIIERVMGMFRLSFPSQKLILSLINRLRYINKCKIVRMDNASLYTAPVL